MFFQIFKSPIMHPPDLYHHLNAIRILEVINDTHLFRMHRMQNRHWACVELRPAIQWSCWRENDKFTSPCGQPDRQWKPVSNKIYSPCDDINMTSPVVRPFLPFDSILCHMVFGTVILSVLYPQAYGVSNIQETEREASAKEEQFQ